MKKKASSEPSFSLSAAWLRLDVLGLDVTLRHAIGGEDDARVDQRARARLVERDALALEVGGRLHAEALADDDVHALGVQVGDQPQLVTLGLPS